MALTDWLLASRYIYLWRDSRGSVLDELTAGLDRALRARVARGVVLDGGRVVRDDALGRLVAEPRPPAPLGLLPPPVGALAAALALPECPIREAEAARALRRVAPGRRAP